MPVGKKRINDRVNLLGERDILSRPELSEARSGILVEECFRVPSPGYAFPQPLARVTIGI